jgi:NADH dehydrogenase
MIVVTGASGYLGSHIVRRLVEDGKKVRVLIRDKNRASKEQRLQGLEVEWVEADVTKPETLVKAFEGATAVVHTVAIAIEKGGRTYEEVNYQGTVHVVDAARQAGVKRLINISQLGAKADLPYRFLASKGKAQEYVAASGLDWTALRPSVIWGPEDEFANTFAKLAPITPLIFPIIGDQETKFQPIWVEDVVTSVVKSLEMPEETIGHEYELGGPEILTLEEIERRTLQAIQVRRKFVHFPLGLLRGVVAIMEVVLPAPPVTRSLVELLQIKNVTSKNAIDQFVKDPLPFTPENTASYMRQFRVKKTIAEFMGK